MSSIRPYLAIIVINYKMEELTISFIQNELAKVTYPHITVVVNNSATDTSNTILCNGLGATLVTTWDSIEDNNNNIYILSSQENLGFAKANNLGVEFCRNIFNPQYFLFTNNDVQFKDENVVELLINKLQSTPDAGVIGPHIVGLDGKEQSPHPYMTFWDRMIWMYWSTFFYSKEKKNRRFQLDYPQKAQEGFHYYVMGSFFMVRAKDFFHCGMMDSNTFMYAEELILSERMKAIGKGVYYYPKATVIHAHGATTGKHAQNKSREWQFESLMYYYITYHHINSLMLQLGRMTHWLKKKIKR